MVDAQPVKVVYFQPSVSTVRKNSYRSPKYINVRTNRILPRPVFTCIDEIYSAPSVSNASSSAQTAVTTNSTSQVLKTDNTDELAPKWQKWTIIIVIIIIITCIIAIIILLSVFLTR